MAENVSPLNNVEKSLVEAPTELFPNDPDTNIEIEVELESEPELQIEVQTAQFDDNLSEFLDDAENQRIASTVVQDYTDDRSSREDWEDAYTKGLDLLGLRYENRTEPFAGSSGVVHPLLNEAVTQFQAGAYKELLPTNGPVKTKIIGMVTPELEQQAERVKEFMNFQIMYNMEEYEPEFDQMLYYLGNAGSAFKKIYTDNQLNRPVSKFVPAEDLIVPYSATDLQNAERVTHVIKMSKNELRKLQVSGFYADIEVGNPAIDLTNEIKDKYDDLEGIKPTYGESEEEMTLLECHCYLDLEDFPDVDEQGNPTGIKLPYIVTICMDNKMVLSIRRNFMPDDPLKTKIQYFVHYKFSPGVGFYGFGLIHLLGNLSRTATSTLRQLIDAGTLSNLPAGFKSRGLRIADDDSPLQPGEFRDVDTPAGTLRDALMPLPYKEPSGTLFQLMGFVVNSAEKFIGTQEISVGEGRQDLPVGTTVALLERGSKVMSAVHKRLHAALKIELKLLANLFAEAAPTVMDYPYMVDAQGQGLFAQDFSPQIDILPVSDPNMFSMAQRVMLAQEQLQMAMSNPEIHNIHEAYRRVYSALGIDNIDDILKPPPEQLPMNPAMENAMAPLTLTGGAPQLKAFPDQDHDAHIAAHFAFMQTKIVKTQMAVYAVLTQHIFEHYSLKAEQVAAQQMQQQGLPVDETTQPQYQAIVSQLLAEYVQEFAQMEAQASGQEGQDPLVALKQRELDIKEGELARKQAEDLRNLELDKAKLAQTAMLSREKIESNEDIAQLRANIALDRTHNSPPKQGQGG
jgi:hypothetical protein